jgi:hypothetical protein
MSFTNNFEVDFVFNPSSISFKKIKQAGIDMYDQKSFNGKNGAAFTMYCEEATLPGVQATVANTTGRFLGEGAWSYPTQRMYQDISLTWMCDANMMPLKVLQAWMETIFVDNPNEGDPQMESQFQLTREETKPYTTVTRVNYMDDFKCDFIRITKGERNKSNTIGRQAMIYKLYNAYPYSIESSPLSYGSSQVVKVTANFYYQRWSVRHKPQ